MLRVNFTWKDKLESMAEQMQRLSNKVKSGDVDKELIDEIDSELSEISYHIRKEFWSTVYCDACGDVSTQRYSDYSVCANPECWKDIFGDEQKPPSMKEIILGIVNKA